MSTIISANAHLRLHQLNKCCHDKGICSSILNRLIIHIGIYTEIALHTIITKIEIIRGGKKSAKDISICDNMSHIRINTIEFEMNAKNSQNFCICNSTLGVIL